jgi:hypothetical protein
MYLQLGFLSTYLPGGKEWVRLDLETAGKAMGIDFSRLMGSASQNPSDSLELLRSAGEFSAKGTEMVAGIRATRYHGAIDLDKAAAANAATGGLIQRLRELGAPAQYPADVWIDDSDRVVKMQFATDGGAFGGTTDSGRAEMTMEITGFDVPVDVQPPPADETVDLASLGAVPA